MIKVQRFIEGRQAGFGSEEVRSELNAALQVRKGSLGIMLHPKEVATQ